MSVPGKKREKIERKKGGGQNAGVSYLRIAAQVVSAAHPPSLFHIRGEKGYDDYWGRRTTLIFMLR